MEPPSSSVRRPRQTRLKPDTCLPYKERIRQLYLIENKSMKAVGEALKQEFRFEISNAQLVHLVNEVWHFRKRLKPADHEYIEHRKRKREEEGKPDTRVKLFGVPQNEVNLARKKSRVVESTFQKVARKFQNQGTLAKSPQQPLGLEVGTPTPRSIPANSPMAPGMSPQHVSTPFYCDPSDLYQRLPSLRLEAVFNTLLGRLQGALTPIQRSSSSPLPVSKITEVLSTVKIGQNDLDMSRIANLGGLLLEEELLQTLQPLVVKFGNRAQSPRSLRRALDGFTISDISIRSLAMLKAFFSNITPVIDDFAVQTFYSAARTGNLNLLKLFIEFGILRTSRKNRWHSHARVIGATAVQFSIEFRQGPAISLLLQNKIDVNAQPVSDLSQSLLKTAVEVQDFEVVKQLLELGAQDIVFNEIYECDLTRGEYLRELRAAGLTWVAPVLGIDESTYGLIYTALQSAICLTNDDIFELLIHDRIEREQNGQQAIPFDSISHIIAVYMARFDRLEAILSCDALHIDIDGVDIEGSTALSIAESSDLDEHAALLMKHGATGNSTRQPTLRREIPESRSPKQEISFSGISRNRVYEILDELRSSSMSFQWKSYLQTLEAVSHLETYFEFNLESYVSSSDPRVEIIICNLEINFSRQEYVEVLDSLENISGSLLVSANRHDGSGNLRIGFEVYSKQVDILQKIIDSKHGEDSARKPEIDERGSFTYNYMLPTSECEVEPLLEDLAEFEEEHPTFDIPFLNWAREMDDHKLHKALFDHYLELIPSVDPEPHELSALLALAVRSNLRKEIRQMIPYSPKVDKVVLLEAAWDGDNATFELVFDLAKHNNNLEVPLELLTLIAIHIGHIFKVVRLLDREKVDANHILEGGTTFLETAATLGRLDIVQVLLNAGASYRLQEAKDKAEKSGNFVISDMIKEKIQHLDPDINMATPSDLSTPVAANNEPSADVNIPAPIVAQSPQDFFVQDLNAYTSSASTQDEYIPSTGLYGLPDDWSIERE